jgi:hypothetical protein
VRGVCRLNASNSIEGRFKLSRLFFVNLGVRYWHFLFVLLVGCSDEKSNCDYYDLRENADMVKIGIVNSLKDFIPGNGRKTKSGEPYLNYTSVLLKTWSTLKADTNAKDSIGFLSQGLSYIGDVSTIYKLKAKQLNLPELPDKYVAKHFGSMKVRSWDAKELILEQFKTNSVVMLNEAHDRPGTRTFLLSILKDLKKAGVTCLALETLNPKGNLNELDYTTGYYTNEPVFGQVIREALKCGFKLIAYEISEEQTKQNFDREFAQASNLLEAIKKKDRTGFEKTILLGGYGHIDERSNNPVEYQMMALQFKKISGLDPVTISQLSLMEYNFEDPGRRTVIEKLVHPKTTIAFNADEIKPIYFHSFYADSADMSTVLMANDFIIYQPATRFSHNRPNWMLTTPATEFFPVEIPKNVKPVLVQAYIKSEIKTEKDFLTRVPFDQTFSSENGNGWLSLKKGDAYIIVFRGQDNSILLKKEITP